jgi:hypothetical protein
MNAGELKPDSSGPVVDAEARRLADAGAPGELRQLLLQFAPEIRHTLTKVQEAVMNAGRSPGPVSPQWRQMNASLIHRALTQYYTLSRRIAELPLAAFNDRPDLRAELLSSLTLTEVGLIELAAGTSVLGTRAADARLAQATNALRAGHTLAVKVSKSLGLSS